MSSLEERLIESVRQHKYIYDKSDSLYKNINIKNKAWDEIAKKLNIKSEHAKKRWKTLRDRYIRQKKSIKISARGRKPSLKKKTWKYREALEFLDDVDYCYKSEDDSDIDSSMDDERPGNCSPTPPKPPPIKKKTHVDDEVMKDAFRDISDLISTAETAFSGTTPVRSFLYSLALEIEEGNLSFKNMCVLQIELLSAVHKAIKRQNNKH